LLYLLGVTTLLAFFPQLGSRPAVVHGVDFGVNFTLSSILCCESTSDIS
jgi:hypothetical protein